MRKVRVYHERRSIRLPPIAEESRLHRCGRAPVGPRHRGEHGGVQCREQCVAVAVAVSRTETSRHGLGTESSKGYEANTVSGATFADWREQNQVFESMAAFTVDRGLNLTGDGEPERITAVPVAENLFPLLGVAPIHGRAFTPEGEAPGRDWVAHSEPWSVAASLGR